MSYNCMECAEIQGQPIGALVTGGNPSSVTGKWTNKSVSICYLWGVNLQLDLGLTIPPAGSLYTGAGNAFGLPSGECADLNQYLRNVADCSIYMVRESDGMGILGKGSDHYDNFPGLLWENPCWFPIPFKIQPGDSLILNASVANGYQKTLGGEFGYSATAAIYYTTGQTGNTNITG